jgi:hypothetical protein
MSYLHKEELKKLSGAKQRRTVAEWLSAVGIPYINDASGWPLVAESAIHAKLGQPVKQRPRINFA